MTDLISRDELVTRLEQIVAIYRDEVSAAITGLNTTTEQSALMRAELYSILSEAERHVAAVAAGRDAFDPNFTDEVLHHV